MHSLGLKKLTVESERRTSRIKTPIQCDKWREKITNRVLATPEERLVHQGIRAMQSYPAHLQGVLVTLQSKCMTILIRRTQGRVGVDLEMEILNDNPEDV